MITVVPMAFGRTGLFSAAAQSALNAFFCSAAGVGGGVGGGGGGVRGGGPGRRIRAGYGHGRLTPVQ